MSAVFDSVNEMLIVLQVRKADLFRLAPEELDNDARQRLVQAIIHSGTTENMVARLVCETLWLELRRKKYQEPKSSAGKHD